MALHSKRSREGYLLIDHSNSPGVSEEFIRASGLDAPVVGAGQVFEAAILLCGHCQRGLIRNPNRTRERAWCMTCDHYICDECAALKTCAPFKKVLSDAYEKVVRNIAKDISNG